MNPPAVLDPREVEPVPPLEMNPSSDFRHLFTATRHVPVTSFENALFFECAPLHVLAVTLFCDGARIPALARDRELVVRVSTACFLDEVASAIDEYCWALSDDTWLRRVGRFRLSTRKLHRIAQRCLPPRPAAP